ncbi:hypothetical protein CPB86DRAFT_568183 [Serendipita vermifera]|nr:hypothetical protein CPB86DRAFT_568183 [Serendipita vermifera]
MASYHNRASETHKSTCREYFFECNVCFDTKTIRNSRAPQRISKGCNHQPRMCLPCLSKAIKGQFESKLSTVVHCPDSRCSSLLEFHDVKSFAPPDIFARYDFLVNRQFLEKMSDFRWCLNQAANCPNGFIYDGGSARPQMTCPDCKFVMCFTHQVGWHLGQTCEQYEKDKAQNPDVASDGTLDRIKHCPKCTSKIDKDGGCDHMTCSRCAHEFCWICLVDYKEARRGAIQHATKCKYRT